MSRILNARSALILLLASHFGILSAAGPWLYEVGTVTSGMAGAGRAALAMDASTSYDNPAGMTRIPKNNVIGGVPLLFYTYQFRVNNSTIPGGNGGNAARYSPTFALYYSQNLLPDYLKKFKIGFNANSYILEDLRYTPTWAGRYYCQKRYLYTFKTNTVLAYPIFKGVSIGAGYVTMNGRLRATSAVNNSPDTLSDGGAKTDQSELSFGGNGGILIEPTKYFRFGVSYRSPVHIKFRNSVILTGLEPSVTEGLVGAKLLGNWVNQDVYSPQEFIAGIYSALGPDLAMVIDGGWQGWSKFDHVQPTVPTDSDTLASLTHKRRLKDTWHSAIGFQLNISKFFLVETGFSYDSSPIDKKNRTPDFPYDRQFRYGAGIQFNPIPTITIGTNYEFADLGVAPINQNTGPLTGTLNGKYVKNRLSAVTFYGGWTY